MRSIVLYILLGYIHSIIYFQACFQSSIEKQVLICLFWSILLFMLKYESFEFLGNLRKLSK